MIRPQHTRKSSLTFSVPSVLVTASDRRPSLSVYEQPVGAPGSAGQISPLSLPRPPRCLTPYPDTLGFPHSHEPSPLSSPAFSASSLPGDSDDDDDDDDNDSEDEDHYEDEDGDEGEGEMAVSEPKTIMSPTTMSKAHARLLAPALHMSHLNSPTDIKFLELPLSPMRKVKSGSGTLSPLVSPVYTTYDGLLAAPIDNVEKAKRSSEPIRLSLGQGEGIIKQSKNESKTGFSPQEGRISVHVRESSGDSEVGKDTCSEGSEGQMAVSKTCQRVGRTGKIEMVHELQVHVETVD